MKISALVLSLAAMLAGSAAVAQQGINRVAVHTDWAVFAAASSGSGFADCWGASEPKSIENTRGGQVVQVRRGDIQLMVSFVKGSASPQVAFTGGYPFADGGTVEADVDGQSFTLMTLNQSDANGDRVGWAWPRDPADEARIVSAMKRGSQAVLIGRSSRGTQTKDTFSLSGFTAAVDAAQRQCAG